jgi:glycosyltransferase involved in cell wall biosynthesis
MRIAIIAYIDIGYGMGATRRVTMLAQGLRDCGDEVHLVGATWGTESVKQTTLDAIQVHDVGPSLCGRGMMRAGIRRLYALRTFTALAREGLDWALLYNLGIDSLPFVLLAKRKGCGIVIDNADVRHGGDIHHIRQLLEGVSYRLADRLIRPLADINIVVSSYLERLVKQDAPRTPTVRIPALIDTRTFRTDPIRGATFRNRWSLGTSPIVGYLGGTQKFEGLNTLLRAFARLREQGLDTLLFLAGDLYKTDLHEDLPSLVAELRLEDSVILAGRLSTEEVIDALSGVDVLVVPKHDERANIAGFPQKLVEYLAAGKPVVATAVGDVPLYLHQGVNAILCCPDDPMALAEAIALPLLNPGLARSLGTAARATAVSHFDKMVQVQGLRKVCGTFSKIIPPSQTERAG